MGTRLAVAPIYCPTECNADTTGKDCFLQEFQVAVEGPKGCSRVAHSSMVSVICGDFNGELAAYDPSEIAAAGLGHIADDCRTHRGALKDSDHTLVVTTLRVGLCQSKPPQGTQHITRVLHFEETASEVSKARAAAVGETEADWVDVVKVKQQG